MVLFKACPRCHGDMHESRDMYGRYKECLACGHMIDLPAEVPRFEIVIVKRGRRKNKAKAA